MCKVKKEIMKRGGQHVGLLKYRQQRRPLLRSQYEQSLSVSPAFPAHRTLRTVHTSAMPKRRSLQGMPRLSAPKKNEPRSRIHTEQSSAGSRSGGTKRMQLPRFQAVRLIALCCYLRPLKRPAPIECMTW